jgi:hypothetical protein
MISALLDRFFRHCINMAAKADSLGPVKVHEFDPAFMTDQEISDFLHGRSRLINWDHIAIRKRSGALIRPRATTEMMELVP